MPAYLMRSRSHADAGLDEPLTKAMRFNFLR